MNSVCMYVARVWPGCLPLSVVIVVRMIHVCVCVCCDGGCGVVVACDGSCFACVCRRWEGEGGMVSG